MAQVSNKNWLTFMEYMKDNNYLSILIKEMDNQNHRRSSYCCDKGINNLKDHTRYKCSESNPEPAAYLNYAFDWSTTSQRSDYWSNIYGKIQRHTEKE